MTVVFPWRPCGLFAIQTLFVRIHEPPGSLGTDCDLWCFDALASKADWMFCWRATVLFRFLGIAWVDRQNFEVRTRHIISNWSYIGNSTATWCIFVNPIMYFRHLGYYKHFLFRKCWIIDWRTHFFWSFVLHFPFWACHICPRDVRSLWMTPILVTWLLRITSLRHLIQSERSNMIFDCVDTHRLLEHSYTHP